jgi:hypothetical protein
MKDRSGKLIHIGDIVKYWHKIDGRSTPEIGEIIEFSGFASEREIAISRKFYNNTDVSYRSSSGITLLSKEEAMLWKLEQYISNEVEN